MLVLTRKVGQKIVLPSCNTVITITAIRGSQVNLGIAAPPEITVNREEVARRITEELEERTRNESVPSPHALVDVS